MGAPFLLPNLNDVNSQATTDATNTSTTLDNTGDSSISAGDILDDLINVAPSLLLLSRTPQNRLPVANGGTAASPTLAPAANTLTSSSFTLLLIILIMAITAIIIFKK